MRKDKPGKKEFWKKIKYPHPLSYFKKSPIDIMFKNPHSPGSFYPWPSDRYFDNRKSSYVAPFRLIDAIDEGNEIILMIGLNFKTTEIKKEFSKVLNIAIKEIERHGRSRSKISDREYVNILKAYQRSRQGWKDLDIAKEMFPGDFKETKDGGKAKSAIEKARRFRHEAERLLGIKKTD